MRLRLCRQLGLARWRMEASRSRIQAPLASIERSGSSVLEADDCLVCVAPEYVAQLWPHVRAMIDAAFDAVDEYEPADLFDKLCAGRLLLWLWAPNAKIEAALITALVPRPSGLTCRLLACGGHGLTDWIDGGHEKIEAYARAEGCVKMEIEGRTGWARVRPEYRAIRIVLEKAL